MTKEQIQALIDAKIAGQGSAVDVGGALPAILSEILNLATEQPQPEQRHTLRVLGFLESGTIQQALELLELDGETPTLEQLSNIDICNTTVKRGIDELAICGLSGNVGDTETNIYIDAGYWCQDSQGIETGYFLHIALEPDGAVIQFSEL